MQSAERRRGAVSGAAVVRSQNLFQINALKCLWTMGGTARRGLGTGKSFLHLTTEYRSKIKPTPKLSSNIHYQNYGHHGLFPVITSRLAPYLLPIGGFFVPNTCWPMGTPF